MLEMRKPGRKPLADALMLTLGGLGNVNHHVVDHRTKQRCAVSVEELQIDLSVAPSMKELPMRLVEEHQDPKNASLE
jgi:hypothetical protein